LLSAVQLTLTLYHTPAKIAIAFAKKYPETDVSGSFVFWQLSFTDYQVIEP